MPRNTPARSRSARTIAESTWVVRSSSRKRAMAMGTCVAATPEISTRNWASAGPASARPEAAATEFPKERRFINMNSPDFLFSDWFNGIARLLRQQAHLQVAVVRAFGDVDRQHEAEPPVEK